MGVQSILSSYQSYQLAFYGIVTLQLTGFMFPPPAQLIDGDTYDYIIVGGGTAGCALAANLAKKKYNILLIEAGPDAPYETMYPNFMPFVYNSHVDWNYTTKSNKNVYRCQVNNKLDLNIARMLGGTSSINNMIYSKGNPSKRGEWFELTKSYDWTSYNITKYYLQSENVMDSAIRQSKYSNNFGSKGPIGVTRNQDDSADDVLKGFEQIGEMIIPDIDGNRKGFAKGLVTIQNGIRDNLGPTCLADVTENQYIAVAKNTLATKIVINENKEAIGVNAITNSGEKVFIKLRKEVIISAGAIKSPQLLKLSGIGPERELRKFDITPISDLPVGNILKDIPAVVIVHKTNKPYSKNQRDKGDYPSGLIVGYQSIYSNTTFDYPPQYTVNIFVIDNEDFLVYFCAVINKFYRDICDKLLEMSDGNQVIITVLGHLYSKSSGQVTLQSTDPNNAPIVESPNYFEEDIDNMIDYMLDYLRVEDSKAWKSLGATRIDLASPYCKEYKKDTKEYLRCSISCMMVSLKSFSGTCSLGSVVDSKFKIRGVYKARVVDAGVIPFNIGGMVHNTVRMMAEKATDMIIEDAGDKYNSMEHDKIRMDQIQNMPDESILY